MYIHTSMSPTTIYIYYKGEDSNCRKNMKEHYNRQQEAVRGFIKIYEDFWWCIISNTKSHESRKTTDFNPFLVLLPIILGWKMDLDLLGGAGGVY